MIATRNLTDAFTAWRAWRLIGRAHHAFDRGDREQAAALLQQASAAAARLRASIADRGAP